MNFKPRPIEDASLLASARKALATESDALDALAAQLGDSFIKTVKLLVEAQGRCVVSGMGKSGHIARKIAATLASTGTPALFVHPGEASHGDLGMVMQDDVVIALSNSGETTELSDLIAYTRRFSIPLIAMTSQADSTLGRAADTILLLPPVPEACSITSAPTTSTTMMLALGDALAVSVLDYKGFTAEHFRNFHPGGKLGKILVLVSELMHTGDELPIAKAADKIGDILPIITEKRFACAAIIDEQWMLQGIVTDGDVRRHMRTHPDIINETAANVMTRSPTVIPPTMLAAEAINILNEGKWIQLLVVDQGKLVGLLHIHDLLKAGVA